MKLNDTQEYLDLIKKYDINLSAISDTRFHIFVHQSCPVNLLCFQNVHTFKQCQNICNFLGFTHENHHIHQGNWFVSHKIFK